MRRPLLRNGMRRVAIEHFCGLHERFRERRMRMNR